jgi:hypothetical protein
MTTNDLKSKRAAVSKVRATLVVAATTLERAQRLETTAAEQVHKLAHLA